jgi:hypothetical protein
MGFATITIRVTIVVVLLLNCNIVSSNWAEMSKSQIHICKAQGSKFRIKNRSTSKTKTTMFKSDRPWFTKKHFSSLEIIKFSCNKIGSEKKSITIDDAKLIAYFVTSIEQIPSNGKEMISFSEEAERIELLFWNNNESEKIYVFEGRFKTPSTGFNMGEVGIETELYKKIKTLLSE